MIGIYIVVLNWNGWRDTLECLASLMQLQDVNVEIVVVDNASSDESVSHIQKAYPSVTLIQSNANLGFGGGCNLGIQHAIRGGARFVWLVNSDATVDPAALRELLSVAMAQPRAGVIGSVICEAGHKDQVQVWGGGLVDLWRGTSRHLKAAGALDFVSGASMLLRVSALHNTGLFDDQTYFMYWEDTDLCFRLRRQGWHLAVAERSRIWHKESASLGKGSTALDEYFTRSGVRFLRLYAALPWVPVVHLLTRMILKRLLLGQTARVRAVWRGLANA
jgi:GT2 family glycosyltransferase